MLRVLPRLPFALSAVLALTACAGAPQAPVSRNADALHLTAMPVAQQEAALATQADILTARTAEILRKATLRGAGLGAAAGCGLGLATGSGAQRCLGGALAGGALGAAAGHAQGKAQIARSVEIIDPSPLVASMSKAADAMTNLGRDLPAVIAAQDAELARLRAQSNAGQIQAEAYTQRLAEISTLRQRLAASLDLSQQQAAETALALKAAQAEGQTGLDWHLHRAQRIESDTISARSAITLL